jgi:hypothetical protein
MENPLRFIARRIIELGDFAAGQTRFEIYSSHVCHTRLVMILKRGGRLVAPIAACGVPAAMAVRFDRQGHQTNLPDHP